MVALYFYLIQSRQNILLCKNQNHFFIAVRERQTEPGFGQLNQNILYFCAVIPHNLRHSFVCCGTSETPSPTGLWHITRIFREPCFCYLHGSAVMFVKLARGWSSGTLAAATSSFIPRGQYSSGNVNYEFFPCYKTKRLIKFSL